MVEQRRLDAAADRAPDASAPAGLRRRSPHRFQDHPQGPPPGSGGHGGQRGPRGRGQRVSATHEDAVATALAGALGTPPGDPTPRIPARQVLAVRPPALRTAERWSGQGPPGAQVKQRLPDLVNRSFDLLEPGLAGLEPPAVRGSAPGGAGQRGQGAGRGDVLHGAAESGERLGEGADGADRRRDQQ